MNAISIQYHTIGPGELIIGSYRESLCLCDWRYRKMREKIDRNLRQRFRAEFVREHSKIIDATVRQLEEYFELKRKEFDIPLALAGTEFQVSVWKELQKIPYGKTETYLGLARRLGDEKAIRAVAAANGANAISILVPCHRVTGSNGEMVGYAGGLHVKKKLLNLESGRSEPEQMSLFTGSGIPGHEE